MTSNDRFNLTEEETEKLLQFRELTQLEDELKCVQILRLNDWDLETAISQTLDGAYQAAATSYPESTESPSLRHRQTSPNNADGNVSPNDVEDDNVAPVEAGNTSPSLSVVIWDTASWIICLPFVIAMKTFRSIYEFVLSLVSPAFIIDNSGTVSRHVDEFREKYGDVHPPLNRSNFEDVMKLAKQEIKFLLVYIHSPSHARTDEFCRNILCTRGVVDYLTRGPFIIWSSSANYPDGNKVYQILHGNSFPFVVLFGPRNNKMTLLKKFNACSHVSSFMVELKHAALTFGFLLDSARLEREQRNIDTELRQQQDLAFLQSLQVDKEKARKKKEEETQKAEHDRMEKEAKNKQLQREAKIKQMKTTLMQHLSDEPKDDEDAIRIMFRLPGGKKLERKFHLTDPVRHLYYFVFCNDDTLINFKLHTNFPKIDLPCSSPSPDDYDEEKEDTVVKNGQDVNISECNLDNNIVLFVYDLDS